MAKKKYGNKKRNIKVDKIRMADDDWRRLSLLSPATV